MMAISWLNCFALSFVILSNTLAFTVHDMKRLIEDKSKGYNKKLRPVIYQNHTLDIYMKLDLIMIQEFDEVSGKFSIGGFLTIAWHDELIGWDPDMYNNMTTFAAEGGDFWKPPLVLINPFEKLESVGSDWNIFRYAANGLVVMAPGDIFESSCDVDVTYYPWDKQTCTLLFNSWGYTGDEIRLNSVIDTIGTTFYFGNGVWDLIGTKSVSYIDTSGTSIMLFEINLKRKPRFVLVNVIMPVVFMSFINLLVFWIPTDSGERISFCLTVLLAIAVFLTLVGDNLPKTSNPMSILSYYLLVVLIISICVVLATVFSMRIFFLGDSTPVPGCLKAIVRCCRCRCKRITSRRKTRKRQYYRRHTSQEMNEDNNTSTQEDKNSGIFATNGYILPYRHAGNWRRTVHKDGESYGNVSESLQRGLTREETFDDPDEDLNEQISWKDVSGILDMMLFVFFAIVLIVACAVFAVLIHKGMATEK